MIKTFEWIKLEQLRNTGGYANDPAFVKKAVDTEVEVERNEVVAIVSTSKLDDQGDVVVSRGVDLSRFRKQPNVYLEHDTDALPLGPALWIKATDTSLISKYKIVEDASEIHRAVAALVREGAYRGHSIGFLSQSPKPPTPQELRFHPDWSGAKRVHRRSLLLEFSVTALPVNQDAVPLVIGKSFSKATVDLLSGIVANTQKAVEQAVAEVVKAEDKPKTEAEVRKKLMKEVERFALNIDKDKAIKSAIARVMSMKR